MATARFHKDVHVFLLVGVQPCNGSCRPWVDFTIDEDHLRVVLLEEFGDFLAQGFVELNVLGIVGEHQTLQVTFTGLDGKVFLERLDVVTIIAQFAGCLNEERLVAPALGKV